MKLGIFLLLVSSVLASIPCGIPIPKKLTEIKDRHQRAIIGGNNVTNAKWPWQIRLLDNEGEFRTVISEKWILTAAHCVKEAKSVMTGNSPFKMKGNRQQIIEMITHEEYDGAAAVNDIALLKLETPVIFEDSVSPICLPNIDQPIPNDGYAVATGFGTANERGTNKTFEDEKLRETILPIIPPIVCDTICAGSAGHSAAWGDSGGPLMMKAADGRWFQIGIAVFIVPGHLMEADLGPTAFTDVRTYCDWIKQKTGGEVECQKKKVTLEDVEIQR